MPAGTSRQQFDLSQLRPHLENGALVLTPNQRLARRIKAEWDQSQLALGKTHWQPVAVSALDHWLLKRWRSLVLGKVQPKPIPLTALQQQELWVRVIEADRADNDDYRLLQTTSAADLAKQARELLLRATVDMSAAGVASEFALDPDCSTFNRWLKAFEVELEVGHFTTYEDQLKQLLEAAVPEDACELVLVDFDDLPPLQRACIEHLASSVKELDSGPFAAETSAFSYPDRQAELAAVARWAANEYLSDPQCRLGILLADMNGDRGPLEYLLRREFDCLGEKYSALPVNFSTGITLERAPVVRDALRALSCCGEQISMVDVLGLITSRFVQARDRGSDRTVRLLQQLYDDGTRDISLGRLRSLARNVKVGDCKGTDLGEVLAACSELRLLRLNQSPSTWVAHFTQALNAWGWPGIGPLDSLEYQQVEAWYKVLEEFAGLDALIGSCDFHEAFSLLRRCCQNRISQPQTADSGIQVLGPLEGAGLQFDSIWFCGLQGNRWPAPARPNPFVPMALQKKHAMPHSSSEREWHYAATLMRQYQAGCRQLVASYSRQLDGVPELPSPLLLEFPLEDRGAQPDVPASWQRLQAELALEYTVDRQAPPVASAERADLRGGTGILQQQANCGFRAFAGKRLALEPLGEFRAGLSAAQRGSILHDALFALWGELGDSEGLGRLDAAASDALVVRAVSSAIDGVAEPVRLLVGMHCLDLEQQRLHDVLSQWLEIERQRPPFTVVAREKAITLQLGQLSLSLRVDRVDELADGSRLVIDYKSGRCKLSDWLGERPAQPQLPIYGLADNVSALAFAQVRTRDCKLLGLGAVGGIPGVQDDISKGVQRYSESDDWSSLLAEWERNLIALADKFLAGEANVDPLPAACSFCGFQSLCRVDIAGEERL